MKYLRIIRILTNIIFLIIIEIIQTIRQRNNDIIRGSLIIKERMTKLKFLSWKILDRKKYPSNRPKSADRLELYSYLIIFPDFRISNRSSYWQTNPDLRDWEYSQIMQNYFEDNIGNTHSKIFISSLEAFEQFFIIGSLRNFDQKIMIDQSRSFCPKLATLIRIPLTISLLRASIVVLLMG